MLMIGVTLSFGSGVTVLALDQFNMASGSALLGASLQSSGAGRQVSAVYSSAAPQGGCPSYQGATEGTSVTFALYNYGTEPFTPLELIDNSSVFAGSYPSLAPGSLVAYTVTLSSCAHPSGQTLTAVDAYGDEVQVGT